MKEDGQKDEKNLFELYGQEVPVEKQPEPRKIEVKSPENPVSVKKPENNYQILQNPDIKEEKNDVVAKKDIKTFSSDTRLPAENSKRISLLFVLLALFFILMGIHRYSQWRNDKLVKLADYLTEVLVNENNLDYGIEAKDNSIIISDHDNNNYQYIFKKNDNWLTIEYETNSDDMSLYICLPVIAEGIGKINGNTDADNVAEYISSLQDVSKEKYLKIEKNGGKTIWSISLDAKFDTSSLNDVYFTEENIASSDMIKYIVGDGFYQTSLGNLIFYKTGNGQLAKIWIGEKDHFTNATYKSILTIVKLFYKNELEQFEDNYPNLETKKVGRYNIIVNPSDKGNFEDRTDYKIVKIEITKD